MLTADCSMRRPASHLKRMCPSLGHGCERTVMRSRIGSPMPIVCICCQGDLPPRFGSLCLLGAGTISLGTHSPAAPTPVVRHRVCRLETVKIDTAAIKPSQVVVRMLAAPITPTDLSTIAGFGVPAGSKLTFPRVAGSEGVGVVEAVGGSVAGLKAGDFVVASRPGLGTWATHVVSDADAWTSLTGADAPGSAGLPVEVAATAVASPLLAKHLLAGAAKGSVLVQNCALSTVGQCVIQYAAAKGVKTVNIARRHNDWDNRVHHLQGLGAGACGALCGAALCCAALSCAVRCPWGRGVCGCWVSWAAGTRPSD